MFVDLTVIETISHYVIKVYQREDSVHFFPTTS